MNCCSSKLNYIKLSAISVHGGLKLSLLTKVYCLSYLIHYLLGYFEQSKNFQLEI